MGSGSCSSYPAVLDSAATQEQTTDYVRLDWGRDVEACIAALEAELGADPAGPSASVAARLNMLSNPTGGGVPRGLASARPAASAGVIYFSQDEGVWFLSDGAFWYPILMGGA